MRSLFIFLLLVVFAGCNSSLTHEANDYGDELTLAIGEKTSIGRDKISVEFVDVLEDSRCPSNVMCVWAGNGKVQIRFAKDTVQLNTYLEPHEVILDDVNIELLSLEPYPEQPRQFEKEDYKIRLLITKK